MTDISRRKVYPIYVIIDASASMRGGRAGHRTPLEGLVELVAGMLLDLAGNPVIAHTAALAVYAFSDEAEVLRPIAPLFPATPVRAPSSGTETNYAAILKFIVDRLPQDHYAIEQFHDGYALRIEPPWIFFITDGAPFADGRFQSVFEWLPYRERLVGPPLNARIVALGLPGAHERTLYTLATGEGVDSNAFIAESVTDPDELSRNIVAALERTICASIERFSEGRTPVLPVPSGMRRIHPGTAEGAPACIR